MNRKSLNAKRSRPRQANKSPLQFELLERRQLLAGLTAIDLAPVSIDSLNGETPTHLRSILDHLNQFPETAFLQQGKSDLRFVEMTQTAEAKHTRFQQTYADHAIHDAFVTIVQSSDGEITAINSSAVQNLRTRSQAGPMIGTDKASDVAEQAFNHDDSNFESLASKTWVLSGNRAMLAWQVLSTTSPVDEFESFRPTHQSLVDSYTGELIFQEKVTEFDYKFNKDGTGTFSRIVINDVAGPTQSRAFGAEFDSVVALESGCSGALIAPTVVISARHCNVLVGDEIYFGDNSNSPDYVAIVASVTLPSGSGTLLDGGDVSVLELTQPVPSNVASPMRFIDETDALVGQVAAMAGFGYNGVGSLGHGSTSDGLRWGGENIVDGFGSPAGQQGNNIISTDFDDGTNAGNTIFGSDIAPLPLEATTAPGDSGGPVMVQVDNEWLIAGVLSGGTTPNSIYGDISWWTGTAVYRAFLESFGGEFVGGGLGVVEFDRGGYQEEDTINVTVTDVNGIAPLEVTVTTEAGDSETLTLTFIGGNQYAADLPSQPGVPSVDDGALQVTLNETITVTYVDPDVGDGSSATLTDTALITNVNEYSSTDTPRPINDNSKTTSVIVIPDSGSILDLDVRLDINHTWINDLRVDLTSPAGTTINLFSNIGGNGQSFSNTQLDDEADISINSGNSPFTGSYIPNELLEAFDGESMAGTWTLCVFDDVDADTGTLNAWSLLVESASLAVGSVNFDSDIYTQNAIVTIAVSDANQPTPVTVDVTTEAGDVETVTLAGSNGTYTGTINLDDGNSVAQDGTLQAQVGDTIEVTFIDLDDGSGNSNTVTDVATISNPQKYVSPDVPVDILDDDTVFSSVEVTDEGTVADLNVELDISHTYVNDLEVFLIAPNGVRVELFTAIGGSGNDFSGTRLDDEATLPIATQNAPFAGTYQPEGELSDFDGLDITGIWRLEISDTFNADAGVLNSWCLAIDVSTGAMEPDISVVSTGSAIENESVEFEIRLDGPSTSPVSVDYSTTNTGYDNPAAPGIDYVEANGSVTFQPGETVKTVSVLALNDSFAEANESFGLELNNSMGAVITNGLATVVITDDDLFSLGTPIDFGTQTSVIEKGSIGMNDLEYNVDHGIGWTSSSNLRFVERRRGNDMTVDSAVSRSADFAIDLANGDYFVVAVFGVINRVDPIQFEVEGNANTLTLMRGPNVQRSFTATVNDGQLNLRIDGSGGLSNQSTLSGLIVTALGGRSSSPGNYSTVWRTSSPHPPMMLRPNEVPESTDRSREFEWNRLPLVVHTNLADISLADTGVQQETPENHVVNKPETVQGRVDAVFASDEFAHNEIATDEFIRWN